MTGGFLFIAKLFPSGEWKWFSGVKAARGVELVEVLWSRRPTVDELAEVRPCFQGRPVESRLLDEAVRSKP